MRSMKGFLIVLIGMISMTAFATTSEPARKSDPVQKVELVSTIQAGNVDFAASNTSQLLHIQTHSDVAAISSEADFYFMAHGVTLKIDKPADVSWHDSYDFSNGHVYDIYGKPLGLSYKDAPRGLYIIRYLADKVPRQSLVFKE